MGKPKTWTRAGVRHKTPRWYWTKDGYGETYVAQIHHGGGQCDAFLNGSWRPWASLVADGWTRTVAPIREPS